MMRFDANEMIDNNFSPVHHNFKADFETPETDDMEKYSIKLVRIETSRPGPAEETWSVETESTTTTCYIATTNIHDGFMQKKEERSLKEKCYSFSNLAMFSEKEQQKKGTLENNLRDSNLLKRVNSEMKVTKDSVASETSNSSNLNPIDSYSEGNLTPEAIIKMKNFIHMCIAVSKEHIEKEMGDYGRLFNALSDRDYVTPVSKEYISKTSEALFNFKFAAFLYCFLQPLTT